MWFWFIWHKVCTQCILCIHVHNMCFWSFSRFKRYPKLENWVPSQGWEDPLEKGTATHSSILAWRIPWTHCIVHGVAKSWTQFSDFHFHFKDILCQLRRQRICLRRGRPGFDPESGSSPGGGHSNPLQYSCLENPYGQRNMVGYNPWGRKESNMAEQLKHTDLWNIWIVFCDCLFKGLEWLLLYLLLGNYAFILLQAF